MSNKEALNILAKSHPFKTPRLYFLADANQIAKLKKDPKWVEQKFDYTEANGIAIK